VTEEVVKIPVEKLVVDPKYQARTRLDLDHVARLADTDPAAWLPLLVTPIADQPGMYAVIDGAHRLEAGKKLANGKRVTAYPCRVKDDLGVAASWAANASHPLTICAKDRIRFALGYHQKYPKMSAYEISRRVGLSHSTVSKALAGGTSSGGTPDGNSAVRRVLSAMTYGADAQSDDVYAEVFSSKDPAQVYRAVRHWVIVLSDVVRKAEAETEDQTTVAAD